MLVEGVHDLACDGRGLINADTIQGDILSQADVLPDCMKLIRLNHVTLSFLCSSVNLAVGQHLCLEIMQNEAPEPVCVCVCVGTRR